MYVFETREKKTRNKIGSKNKRLKKQTWQKSFF